MDDEERDPGWCAVRGFVDACDASLCPRREPEIIAEDIGDERDEESKEA